LQKRQPRSLKSRALQLLAQRDQSRLELRRKLLRHARAAAAGEGDGGASDSGEGDADARAVSAGDEVEALLDWLEANRFLCQSRFVESRVHAREARFGNSRIRSELAQHALALPGALAKDLDESEWARAAAVRARRFAAAPGDASERARQSRFLLGRGFSPELVQRLMRELCRPGADAAASARAEPG
jgi:regulatory protein